MVRLLFVAEYRIDDLARTAGTSVRNVRVYQDRGLLPPPERRGRSAVYTDLHLGRLRIVLSMLERGYGFAHIAEMVAAWERGGDLRDLLGLENVLNEPWTDEVELRLTLTELRRMFGGQAKKRTIDRAIELGLLVRHGTAFVAPSPRLLQAGAQLVAIGIPVEAVMDLAGELKQHMHEVAQLFVGTVHGQLVGSHPPTWMPSGEEAANLVSVVHRLRPLAQRAVDAALAQAMAATIATVLDEFVARAVLAHKQEAAHPV